jgi:hypothetical protein
MPVELTQPRILLASWADIGQLASEDSPLDIDTIFIKLVDVNARTATITAVVVLTAAINRYVLQKHVKALILSILPAAVDPANAKHLKAI